MSWKYQIPLIVNKTILLQWFVDNDTDSPGDLVLFRTVSRSRNERTRYGSTLVVFQDQDSQGMYVFYCNTSLLSYIINISSLSSCYVWHDVGKHHPRPGLIVPRKWPMKLSPKALSLGYFLSISSAQWNCFIRGYFAPWTKWKGLYFRMHSCKQL